MGGVFGTSGRKLLLFLRGALIYRCLCFSIKEDLGLKEMDGTLFSWDGAEYSDLAMPVEATRAWHWGRVRFCVYTKQALCFVPSIVGDGRRCRSAAETENCSNLLLMGDGISRGVGSKITQHHLPTISSNSFVCGFGTLADRVPQYVPGWTLLDFTMGTSRPPHLQKCERLDIRPHLLHYGHSR